MPVAVAMDNNDAMPRSGSRSQATDTTKLIGQLGEKIAAHYGVEKTEVRYAEYRYFEPRSGYSTMRVVWERRVDGAWVEEDWRPAP